MKGRVIKLGFISILTISLAAFILLFPAITADGARDGLKICGNIIIPSLFPFCVLTLFAEKSGIITILSKILSPITKRILHLSGEKFCVLIMSSIGGFPVGARLIRSLYDRGAISENEAKRTMLYSISGGPAFILTAVGSGILGSAKLGQIFLISNMLSTLFLAIIIEMGAKNDLIIEKAPSCKISDALVEAVLDSSRAILSICGWVILFSSLLSIIECGLFPQKIVFISSILLEVTTAVIAAKNHPLLIPAILSFCGLCVHCQVYSALKEIAPKYPLFLLFRGIHALFSTAITYLFIANDSSVISTISNNIIPNRNNVSFTYTSAFALILLSILLIVSVGANKKDKIM